MQENTKPALNVLKNASKLNLKYHLKYSFMETDFIFLWKIENSLKKKMENS